MVTASRGSEVAGGEVALQGKGFVAYKYALGLKELHLSCSRTGDFNLVGSVGFQCDFASPIALLIEHISFGIAYAHVFPRLTSLCFIRPIHSA